jgi:hypothetical protein
MDTVDCNALVDLIFVLFPFAAHVLQSWICLLVTYCFGRKKQHPRYEAIAILGVFSWAGYAALKYHERRRITRETELGTRTLEANRRARLDVRLTPPNMQLMNRSWSSTPVIHTPHSPNNRPNAPGLFTLTRNVNRENGIANQNANSSLV